MRIHTDHLTTDRMRALLEECQEDGFISPSVDFAVLSAHGSRSRQRGIEVQLGAPQGTPSFISAGTIAAVREALPGVTDDMAVKITRRTGRRWPRSGFQSREGVTLPTGATWHEWGHFLQSVYEADPEALTSYGDHEAFLYQTGGENMPGWLIEDYRSGSMAWNGRAFDWSRRGEYQATI